MAKENGLKAYDRFGDMNEQTDVVELSTIDANLDATLNATGGQSSNHHVTENAHEITLLSGHNAHLDNHDSHVDISTASIATPVSSDISQGKHASKVEFSLAGKADDQNNKNGPFPFPSTAEKQGAGGVVNKSVTFTRSASIIYRTKAGLPFSEFADLTILDSVVIDKMDAKSGTLGELKHYVESKNDSQVKKFLRHNEWSPRHRIRLELWKTLCQEYKDADAQLSRYEEVAEKLRESPFFTSPAILSSARLVINSYMLKPSGITALKLVLTVIEHERPDFAIIPVIYPLGALFLHYMSDAEAFVCLMHLISHSQKFLLQTEIAIAATKKTLLVLVNKHLKHVLTFLRKVMSCKDDKELVPLFDYWKEWIFVALPFAHIVRIIDCFLYEGHKIFFRIALAITEMWYKEKHNELKHVRNLTCSQLSASMNDFCKTISVSPAKLLKIAFGIRNLKSSQIRKLQEKHELSVRRVDSGLANNLSSPNLKSMSTTHHFIEGSLKSDILTDYQSVEILQNIPTRYQLEKFSRAFSTNVDGMSFNRLWSKIDGYQPTILVIRTSKNEIFGAFCSESWSTRRKSSKSCTFGTGETFVFAFKPKLLKYPWVGQLRSVVDRKEELFQMADTSTLVIGGCSISIRDSLEVGSSEYSATFDCPPLSATIDYNIGILEVFGIFREE